MEAALNCEAAQTAFVPIWAALVCTPVAEAGLR